LRRRIVQLLWGGLAMVVTAGWWVAIVELVPARYRPYVGGSQNNSVLDLIFGYNGFSRLFGNSGGPGGGAGGPGRLPGGFSAGVGVLRLFGAQSGGQIAWLLPAALILLLATAAVRGRAPRTDRTRAGLIMWAGWLLVTGVVFSFMEGIYHDYYTVALAPAVAAVVAVGTVELWRRRDHLAALAVLAGTAGATATWAWWLLGRSPHWLPWLRWLVLAFGLAAAVTLLGGKLRRRLLAPAAVAAVVAASAAPFGYALNTAATEHRGPIPTAGPAAALAGGPGGGFPAFPGGTPPGFPGGALPSFPAGGLPGGSQGNAQGGNPFGNQPPNGFPAGGGRAVDDTPAVAPELVTLLERDAGAYTWVAATARATSAAGYQLATKRPVMAIGGFGTDPWPTLKQFQQYVAEGKIHYLIGDGPAMAGPGGFGENTAQQITQWVADNFTATTVAGVTVYDLSAK
jgi:4-amino-4-deoxy-L-arabinose transferase-like glycosyltransferase